MAQNRIPPAEDDRLATLSPPTTPTNTKPSFDDTKESISHQPLSQYHPEFTTPIHLKPGLLLGLRNSFQIPIAVTASASAVATLVLTCNPPSTDIELRLQAINYKAYITTN
ncbi:hypothetical protein BGX21_000388 [Mortierella sp. AD011]|nr:hypothetical protein BGX21_000388 [Mortierella sp. AD011]